MDGAATACPIWRSLLFGNGTVACTGEHATHTLLRSFDDRHERQAPTPSRRTDVGVRPTTRLRGGRVNAGAPQLVRVENRQDLPEQLRTNGIAVDRPVLACIGGASGMSDEIAATLGAAFQDLVAPAVDRWSATVVDGGTDAGVMRMVGRARAGAGCSFPLVGVAAIGTVELPDGPHREDAAALEPNHTHVVLVPGDSWGDETPWLSAVAGEIAWWSAVGHADGERGSDRVERRPGESCRRAATHRAGGLGAECRRDREGAGRRRDR